MQKLIKEIVEEVEKAIVGKGDVVKKVLMAMLAEGHILLEDVPGVGKTTLALAFSKAMRLEYNRVQFTPDTMASDIIGFTIYNKDSNTFEYKSGAVLCNLFLADEINRTSPKTQAALLEAMAEKKVTVESKTYNLPEPFICIATQNPTGSSGTQKLPDSQLDRFMIKLSIGYPDISSQVDIIKERHTKDPLESIKAKISLEDINRMKEAVTLVHINDDLIEYAATLCEKTRSLENVEQGISPRGVIALVRIAKASAYMEGRDYVVPEDIKNVFVDVCSHRLILTAKAKIKKETEEKILLEVLGNTDEPKLIQKQKESHVKK